MLSIKDLDEILNSASPLGWNVNPCEFLVDYFPFTKAALKVEELKMNCNVCKRNVREHEKNCWWCGVSNPSYSPAESIPEVEVKEKHETGCRCIPCFARLAVDTLHSMSHEK